MTPKKRARRWIVGIFAALLIGGGFLAWNYEPHPGRYDETLQSTFLSRDLRRMWTTQRLRGLGDSTDATPRRASTDAAINAASRVFNTVQLAGLSREEVVATVGDPKSSNDSIYNFPFWPAGKGSLVYRFDSGAYGWQFDVQFDAEGKVNRVERRWIH